MIIPRMKYEEGPPGPFLLRNFMGVNMKLFDVIVKRWEDFTGGKANRE